MRNGGGGNYYLSWDTSPGTFDYDLYLFDSTLSNVVQSSTNGSNAFESFTWTNTTGADQTVHLAVRRVSGGSTEMEVFVAGVGTWQEHIISQGSTNSPSNATGPGVISTGAVVHDLFGAPSGTPGLIHRNSGRGPSNSGLTLPDICGPTETVGFTYPGGFGYTSGATANVAGVVTVLWSCDPSNGANLVRERLFEWAAALKDWGQASQDNTYGHGGIALPAAQDCNGNGVPDGCDLVAATSGDCNSNLVPDECDLAEGTSRDCQPNGIPDECEFADCNLNCVPDDQDIAGGTSQDCNANGVPDECRPGDIDGDGDVDLNDFASFALCYTGAAVTNPPAGCGAGRFCSSDLDGDGDVDLADFATFAQVFGR